MHKNKKNILIYPRQHFIEDLILLRQEGEVFLQIVLNETSDSNQWIVHEYDKDLLESILKSNKRWENGKSSNSDQFVLKVMWLANSSHPVSTILQLDDFSDAHLYLDVKSKTRINSISGFFKYKNKILHLDELSLVGSEMLKIPSVNSKHLYSAKNSYEDFLNSDYAEERWRMTRKALGDNVWKRLCLSKIMIVGCGRTGEMMALELIQLGVGNIVLCDGDTLERRNIGEMKLTTEFDVGRNKAEVESEKLNKVRQTFEPNDCFEIKVIETYNFDSLEAQIAAEECDIIICCIDSDGGRGYASYIASRYHKVLIDIGTGILRESNNIETKGYDLRLILPGDGCLKCFGGFDEERSEIEIFNSYERDQQRENGHLQRVGSISSLNMMAVGEAVRLLQELVAGKRTNSTWIQFNSNWEFEDNVWREKSDRNILNSITKSQNMECDCITSGLGQLIFQN